MNRSFFLLFFICAFNLYYLVPSSSATPIIGGTLAENFSFKHHVSLHRTTIPLSDQYEYFCGGSLISEKHVLSAARCFLDKAGHETTNLFMRRPKIIAGSNFREGPGTDVEIFKVFIPRVYVSNMHNSGDICVVELSSNIDVSNDPYMSSIHLLDLEPQDDKDKAAVFPGFGVTSNYGTSIPMAEMLYYLDVHLMPWENCPGDGSIICATSRTRQVKTACYGDTGGGLMVGDKIVGVLNYGPLACDVNTEPIIFTRIQTFRNFIYHAQNPQGNHRDMVVLSSIEEVSSSRSARHSHSRSTTSQRRTRRPSH